MSARPSARIGRVFLAHSEHAKIGSLWIGGALSWIERASLQSFVRMGHDYVLYAYDEVPDLPNGVTQRDARDIWDTDDILYHTTARSPAIHADVFRALMVQQTGRVWVDTDVIALQPFPADLEWYIGYERSDRPELGNAIMGMPADAATLAALTAFLTGEAPIPPWLKPGARQQLEQQRAAGEVLTLGDLAWGATGPKALTYFARQTGEIAHAQPQGAFFPVAFQQRKWLTDPAHGDAVAALLREQNSLCVHLYARWLRKFTRRMTGQRPDPGSWLGRWLTAEGLVDETAPTDNLAQARMRRSPPRTSPKIDRDSFFADLARLRKNLPCAARSSRHGRITAVTMAKDEGPYILEWVAHHYLLGFTNFLVYTNDCTDGTAEMFDALHSIGLVSHCDNSGGNGKAPQSRALAMANRHPLVKNSDWVMVFDLDEFIVIRHGDGCLDSLLDVITEKDANAMALTWRFFGSAGQDYYEDGAVTSRFQRAADNNFAQGFGVKTIFKYDRRMRLAVHRPKVKKARNNHDGFKFDWLNGSAQPIDENMIKWRHMRSSVGYDLAQVNHYGVKSPEEFLLRRFRGDVLDNHDKYDAAYFDRYDRNEIADESALRFASAREALIEKLRSVAAVREAEQVMMLRHNQRVEQLRAAENYQQLMQQLRPEELGKE